jgi:ABC-type antimicrobial peptide transport system permease subunit
MRPDLAAIVVYYGFGFLWALVFALLSAWVAGRKGRSPLLWGILGFFFSLITLIIVLLLPRRR